MPKNLTTFVLSIFSGILLVISGISGSLGVYGTTLSTLTSFSQDKLTVSILESLTIILIFLASLGGFAVILGGFLIYKSQVRLGKFILGLGAGVGIPGLLLTVITAIVAQEFSVIMTQYGIFGWTGIVLSFIARAVAK